MSELITQEIFTDGQQNINAANMNGIIGKAVVQPDIIATKATSATMDVADLFLVLKTNNTLAKARFDTLTNSVASTLPLADTTKNGALRKVSGVASDYVGGDNNCHPLTTILPPGMLVEYAGPNIPAGWLYCDGTAVSRTVYSNLYAAIGGYYGTGDGSTTFNLPNFAGRTSFQPGGSIGGLGTVAGSYTVILSTANLPAHSHTINDPTHAHATVAHTHTDAGHLHTYVWPSAAGSQWGNAGPVWGQGASNTGTGYASLNYAAPNTDARATNITINNTGSGTPVTLIPPFVAVYKIIKY